MDKRGRVASGGYLAVVDADLGQGQRLITTYLPAGWPRARPEVALYYLHGAGYDDTSLLGTRGLETCVKRDLDEAIATGDIPPAMIVCPHYSDATTVEGAMDAVSHAADMLRRLVSYSETTFLCHVDRPRRAIAGFSMGGAMVWEALVSAGDLFSVYVPVGSDCWSLGYEGGRLDPMGTAALLADGMVGHAESGATRVRAWCGQNDPSAPWVERQVAEMRRLGIRSTSFSVVEGIDHTASSAHPAILDCLRLLADSAENERPL